MGKGLLDRPFYDVWENAADLCVFLRGFTPVSTVWPRKTILPVTNTLVQLPPQLGGRRGCFWTWIHAFWAKTRVRACFYKNCLFAIKLLNAGTIPTNHPTFTLPWSSPRKALELWQTRGRFRREFMHFERKRARVCVFTKPACLPPCYYMKALYHATLHMYLTLKLSLEGLGAVAKNKVVWGWFYLIRLRSPSVLFYQKTLVYCQTSTLKQLKMYKTSRIPSLTSISTCRGPESTLERDFSVILG